MSAEQHVEATVLVSRTQRNPTMAEGSADLDRPVAEAQPAALVNPAHHRPRAIIKRLGLLRKGAFARAVARGRGRQIERLVRPLGVVHHPPVVKPALALGQIGKGPPPNHLGRQGAMKPLVLALGLRMVRPAMANRDPELEQPYGQPSITVLGIRAPRRTIVHQHAVGQPIAPEDRRQLGLHRALALIATSPQPERIARVIVDHRQRVAAPGGDRKMPLVVHLPQLIRCRPLKPFKWPVLSARCSIDAVMAVQDCGDGAGARRRLVTEILQPATDLAAAPGRVLVTNRQHLCLHRRRGAGRRALRATRAIRQTRLALLPIPCQQPVANRRTDPKPPTQLATVHPVLPKQHHKLAPLRHDRLLRPWHPRLSPAGQRCR